MILFILIKVQMDGRPCVYHGVVYGKKCYRATWSENLLAIQNLIGPTIFPLRN